MANFYATQNIIDTTKRALIKVVYISDGTEDANTLLIDAGALAYALNANGQILGAGTDRISNYRTKIKRISGTAKSNGYISLAWAGDTNSHIVLLSDGAFDFNFDHQGDVASISNPEANATGNILISTPHAALDDHMTIFIDLKKDNNDYDAGQTADPVAFNRGPGAAF